MQSRHLQRGQFAGAEIGACPAPSPLRVTSRITGCGDVVLNVEDATGHSQTKKALMVAINTDSPDFIDSLLSQLANVASKGTTVDDTSLNFMLSVITGIEPRDQMEAMLGAQMGAVHLAAMTFARRLSHTVSIEQQDSAVRAYAKLIRAFASLMECLKKYRGNGHQTVRVEHVTVEAGGQAVVGIAQT